MKNSNKFGCFAIIAILMVILTRCSSCGQSNSHQHENGIYDVEITKVQSKDGDFILKGKTDAPDGSKILAQGTYNKEENEASAIDDDNYAKVKDHKFTMQLDTNNSTEEEIEKGLKIKIKVVAIEKYSTKFKDYYLTKKVRKIISKEIDPITLTVNSKIADYYIDDDNGSEEESDDSDSDDADSDSADTKDENSDSKSEDETKIDSESKAEDKDTSNSDNSDDSSKNSSQSDDNISSENDSTEKTTDTSSQSQDGKVYTGNSNKIIGNARTHKYHVPGQAGYNMNSENAVYFDSEEEAQAAGFVRSKR